LAALPDAADSLLGWGCFHRKYYASKLVTLSV
jgi:hypothetical protein